MADRITNIISKVANTKVSNSDYTGSIKQELAKSINSRLDTQIQNTKDKIASEKNGDKDNKIIEEKAKKYKNEMEKDVSPYLKKRAKVIVSNLFDTDPDIQKAKNEAYDKYIDDFVSKTCEQIDNDAKSLEEYRIIIESVVRSCHDSINNDPELKKEIDKQILTALQDAIVTETMNLMNSQQVNNLVLKENMYITKAGNLAKNLVNSTSFITNLQVDDLLKQYSKNVSKNIAKSISNNTFGKLTELPIIGPLFSPLQKATEKVVTKDTGDIFKFEADVEFTEGTRTYGVRIYEDEDKAESYQFVFNVTEDRYVFEKKPNWPWPANQNIGLERPLELVPGKKYNIKMIVDDTIATIYVDGVALNARAYKRPGESLSLFASEGSLKVTNCKVTTGLKK